MTIALAAPAGVLVGDALGYLAGGPPLGRPRRRPLLPRRRRAGFGPLAVAAQWALFAGQEMVEQTLAGHGPAEALRSPAMWLGLGAQALVALALVVLLRAAGITGARVLASLPRSVRGATAASGWPRSTGLRSPSFLLDRRPTSRGPPPVLA